MENKNTDLYAWSVINDYVVNFERDDNYLKFYCDILKPAYDDFIKLRKVYDIVKDNCKKMSSKQHMFLLSGWALSTMPKEILGNFNEIFLSEMQDELFDIKLYPEMEAFHWECFVDAGVRDYLLTYKSCTGKEDHYLVKSLKDILVRQK